MAIALPDARTCSRAHECASQAVRLQASSCSCFSYFKSGGRSGRTLPERIPNAAEAHAAIDLMAAVDADSVVCLSCDHFIKFVPVFQVYNIVVIHPPTPSKGGFIERNQEFAILAEEIRKMPSPVLLIGDFNCGPWSPAFQKLLRQADLQDSEQGFGPQPSWPARTGRLIEGVPIPPIIPIDHVLASKDVCVQSRIAGPAVESDHLPVFVKLCLPV